MLDERKSVKIQSIKKQDLISGQRLAMYDKRRRNHIPLFSFKKCMSYIDSLERIKGVFCSCVWRVRSLLLYCLIPLHFFFISNFSVHACEYFKGDSLDKSYSIQNKNILFVFRGIVFIIPLEDFTIDKFLEKSILYIPEDIVRDGLPWYGSRRDDWIQGKKVRKHYGLDIYNDSMIVIAPAPGIVEISGRNKISGGRIKIDHGSGIKINYIHLSELYVRKGSKVRQGQVIARIKKPEGNAINTQLHFSLQIDGKNWDPVYFIKITYSDCNEIRELIENYEKNKKKYEQLRDAKVREYKYKSNPQ